MSDLIQIDDKIKLAKTCSTCKFALFGTSDTYYGGKKQGGMCMLYCSAVKPPKKDRFTPYGVWGYWDFETILAKGKDRFGHTGMPTREEFITKSIQDIESRVNGYWADHPERVIAAKAQFEKYYDRLMANYHWWQENYPKCRLIHRQTVCDAYEEGHRGKESFARQIALGNKTLDKD